MRDDLTALTVALIDGPLEDPPWSGFLETLRLATGADYATLNILSPRVHVDEGLHLLAGNVDIEQARAVFRDFNYPDNPIRREWAAEGRPYALAEIMAYDGEKFPEFFAQLTGPFGVAAVREMRIQEPSGVDAWLSVVRNGPDFSAETSELFVALAPLLRGVLRNFVAREQDRFENELARDAVRRLQFGWIVLDAGGQVLRADPFGELVLAQSAVLGRDKAGRLMVKPKGRQREIDEAVLRVAREPASRPRAIQLRGDPWLDMLIVPAPRQLLVAEGAAAAIAYVHGDNWTAQDRQLQLAELFSLTASEAKLALALCRGKTIAEAAGEIGITVQSARTYSKAIFAKTGARGQPDLVRIIMGSILALSPDG